MRQRYRAATVALAVLAAIGIGATREPVLAGRTVDTRLVAAQSPDDSPYQRFDIGTDSPASIFDPSLASRLPVDQFYLNATLYRISVADDTGGAGASQDQILGSVDRSLSFATRMGPPVGHQLWTTCLAHWG